MNEKLTEILDFANNNPSAWLATSDKDQPHVRGMFMWFADKTGFYFHTGKAKRLYSHLVNNPKVEAAFMRNADKPDFETLHVTGIAEFVNDEKLLNRLSKEREWIFQNIKNAHVDTEVVIFRIVKGSAYIWNMSWNLHEQDCPRIKF